MTAMMRRRLVLLALTAGALSAGRGRADETPSDSKEACIHAAERGQKLRDARKLVDARDMFIQCARQVCPSLVRKDCAEWLSEAQVALSSVVFRATDASGKDVIDVHVTVDGTPLTDKLDGSSIAVDSGVHLFRFASAGHGVVEQQLVIHDGEKSRLVTVSFPSAKDTVSAARPIPAGTWVFGSLGVVGIGGFIGLFVSTDSDIHHLQSTCAPSCTPAELGNIRTQIGLTYAALGVGVVSLGVATAWFVVSRSPKREKAAFSVEPTVGGGRARFTVSF
jgi:hypothetical protein